MRYDLKTPCKHCPFRTDETAIRFACRQRAEEIEEHAYRNGFVCHESGVDCEDADGFGYIDEGPNSQHCVGFIIMQIHMGDLCWPGIDNDEDLGERLAQQVNMDAPVFQSHDDFFDANTTGREEEYG